MLIIYWINWNFRFEFNLYFDWGYILIRILMWDYDKIVKILYNLKMWLNIDYCFFIVYFIFLYVLFEDEEKDLSVFGFMFNRLV